MTVSPLADESPRGRRSALRTRAEGCIARLRRIRPLDAVWAGLALASALAGGWLLVGWSVAFWTVAGGVALGVVTSAFDSDHPLVRGVGAALTFPAGFLALIGSVVAAGVGTASLPRGFLVWITVAAVGATGFAAVSAAADTSGGGRIGGAARRARIALVGPVALLALLVLPNVGLVSELAGIGRSLASALLAHLLGAEPSFATVVFPTLVAGAAWILSTALRELPFDAVVSPAHRDRVVATLDYAERGLGGAVAVAIVLLFALPLASVAVGGAPTLSGLRMALPSELAGPTTILLRATGVRVLLLGVAALAGGSLVAYRTVLRTRRTPMEAFARALVPPTASVLAAALLGWWFRDTALLAVVEGSLARTLGPDVGRLLGGMDPFVLGVTAAVVTAAVGVSMITLLAGFARLVLPSRATGAALAGVAVFTLALALTLVGRTVAGFAVAVAAITVWDLGEYTRTLQERLRSAPTIRAEFVHLGGTVAVGSLTAVVALVLAAVLSGVSVGAGVSSLVALLFATLAATLLLYVL